jgi:hypothetical protein
MRRGTPPSAPRPLRIAEPDHLVRDSHRLDDHQPDTLSNRLHAIEESAARAEGEARIVSLQLTELSLSKNGAVATDTSGATPGQHSSRPGPTGDTHGH